jgi:hypothetical protein
MKRDLEVFVDIIKASEDGLPSEIQMLVPGSWNTKKYGQLEITEDEIEGMIENFDNDVRAGGVLPIDIDHDAGEAAGWINKLINRGKEGLWAAVEWTKLGKEKLQEKTFRFFSPEFSFSFEDPLTSENHGPVLVAGTLTNRPLFRFLKPLVAHEGTSATTKGNETIPATLFIEDLTTMAKAKRVSAKKALTSADVKAVKADETTTVQAEVAMPEMSQDEMEKLQTLMAKPLDELSEDELAYLAEHLSMMEDEPQAKYKKFIEESLAKHEAAKETVVTPEVKAEDAVTVEKVVAKEAVKKTGEDEEPAEPPIIEAAEKTVVEASDSTKLVDKESVTISASELKAKEDRIMAAETELKAIKIASEIDKKYMVGATGGKVAPAGRATLNKFMLSMNDDQIKMFDDVMQSVATQKVMGEIGSADDSSLNHRVLADKLISERIAASEKNGKKLSYVDAFTSVAKEKPELFKATSD